MKRLNHNPVAKPGHSAAKGARWLALAALWLILLWTMRLPETFAQSGPPTEYSEYQLKAGYLWNFSRYVDWPARSFKQADSPLVIGILGQDRFGNDLRKLISGRKVEGHNLVVRKVETMDQSRECQILFVCSSE